MIHWVEAHGFECLIFAAAVSGITSVMPPLPTGKGWWTTWGYNVLQLVGMNLGNLVKHSPAGQKLESVVSTTTGADGSKNTTQATSSTIIPKV